MRDVIYLVWRYLVFNRWKTGILIAALRRPATLAKQLSTIDVLSEGRLDIANDLFRQAMRKIGLDMPRSAIAWRIASISTPGIPSPLASSSHSASSPPIRALT